MSHVMEMESHSRPPDRDCSTAFPNGSSNKGRNSNNDCLFEIDSEVDFPGFDRASQQLARKRIYEFKHLQHVNNNTNDSNETTSIVILIEPLSHPTFDDCSKFFVNDVKLARMVEQSQFCKFNIKQITKNFGKKLLIITLEKPPELESTTEQILAINRIGDWQIRCRLPKMHSMSVGVIGPIGLETTNEEITESLIEQGYKNPIAQRIVKGKDKVPTVYIKISIEENQLPDHIYMGYMSYKTRVFIDRPWQCFKCQGFGHNASNCNAKLHCVVCSGPHSSKECPVKDKEEMKCFNCGDSHAANYGGCPFIKHAKVIEKIRAEEKLSYRDAAIKAKQIHNAPTRQQYNRQETSAPNPTSQNNIQDRRRPRPNAAELPKEYKSIATQTVNPIDQHHLEPFLSKIGTVLTNVLLRINTNKEMETIIPNIIQESLGLKIFDKSTYNSPQNVTQQDSEEDEMEEGCATSSNSFPTHLETINSTTNNKNDCSANDNIKNSQKRVAQSPINNKNPTKKSLHSKSKNPSWNNNS